VSTKFANDSNTNARPEKPFIARMIHAFAVPIILGWLAVCVVVTVFVPSLEAVGQERSVSLSPKDAPSFEAMGRIGMVFKEGDSDSFAMVIIEGNQPLGDAAHKYYDGLVAQLRADKKHVQSVQDLWGDPLTAAGVQSNDGKAAYVQLSLAGNQGTPLANESVEAVRSIVESTPAPPGIKAYVTGPSALAADMHHSGDRSMARITMVTVAVIFIMLLLVYRSIITVVLLLITVGVELTAARGVVAVLGHSGAIGLTTFAVSLLTSLAIAAGTDYGIFIIGRYQEARQAGEDKEAAYYTMYRGTAHVILGSGLTIAGATFCLSFARMPYFQTLGIPCAVGMLVAVAVALTLGPAVLHVGSRFGLFDPKRLLKVRGWRRVGTVVVRWPLPVLVATCAIALVGLLALPGYKTSYNDRDYLPDFIPANQGYAAADRHFSQARMKPEILMIESDHDMRNPADFLVLDKLAKGIFRVPGISRVQAITRPEGTTMDHTGGSSSPPEVFKNKDFQRAMKSFLSSDGHAARFIILHRGDPQSPEGIKSIDAIRTAAEESLKGTPLEDAKIYLAGTAAVFHDISEGAQWDLLIAAISSLCLIFIIMLIITRAFIAAAVIVGTVALSLGASFGLSVLLWQHILAIHLHWLVLAMSVIVLLAVGSDYNLLLVSRFKQEIGAGLKTGIIRSMGGTGKVVTNAGLVFAVTMASMAVSDLRVIGQVGTTIGLGLLFDTLIVRSFMTPSIAALLGRWFWWPLRVRSRPARTPTVPSETQPAGRPLAMSSDRLGALEVLFQ
uniref:Siderophore exporter MmpL4 n=1 Tax=Mycobacterium tuberculosis TaxID=1773 RepID=UPI0039FDE1C2